MTFPPSQFIPAKTSHEYKSYSGVPLNIGDAVYQITFTEGSGHPVLIKFLVSEKINDGRIKIKAETTIGSTLNINEQVVLTSNVHTDPVALLMDWLSKILFQLEIELPTKKKGIEDLIKQIKPDFNGSQISVGVGVTEQEI